MKLQMKSIAVYSGSFNPLHIGHLAIMKTLAESFDKVCLVVSPRNPLKESATAGDAPARLEAAVKALARHPELSGKVEVSDIEFRLGEPNYTIRTLDALKEENPDCGFTLTVGADQLDDFRRWKDYCRILTEYGVVAFPREGFDLEQIAEDLLKENRRYRIRTVNMPLVQVSSSQIRRILADGLSASELMM